jgi:hypothetical protein
MPYTIKFGPRNPIPGVREANASKDSAAAAWVLVQQLQASDERAEITDPSGQPISWQELRLAAEQEAGRT